VLRREPATRCPPASTQKSYVGLGALVSLGPDARLRTEVARDAEPVGGVLRGSLWLVAGGDPYLTRLGLRQLARVVRTGGITTVTGEGPPRRRPVRQPAHCARVEVVVHAGSGRPAVRAGRRQRTLALRQRVPPGSRAARGRAVRDYLREEGVSVGAVRREARPAGAVTVAQRVSGPVPAVVRRALKDSDNFATELLLKEVGRVVRGDGQLRRRAGRVRDVLGEHAVPVGAGSDGSGLSSHDRQTTSGQLLLLKAAEASGSGEPSAPRCRSAAATARSSAATAAPPPRAASSPRPARCRRARAVRLHRDRERPDRVVLLPADRRARRRPRAGRHRPRRRRAGRRTD
jgi:D-alanyl-D-alanine carboxypeptidase